MSQLSQQPVAFPSEDRRTALVCCFPLAVTSTFVALEYALQALVLCFDGVPLRIIHQVVQLVLLLSFHPFAPQTSELYYHSFLASFLFVVLLLILAGSCYVILSVGEDVIRILAPPHFRSRSMRRHIFPRKVFFRISLPVGVPSLDDMLSPPHVSSRTIPSATTAQEDEAACEEFHPTPLQRVYISLLNTFTLQLEKANTILVAVSMSNKRWIAMMVRIATERRGMESQKISADVSPANSKNPQQWYYKNKDRCNDFFKALARKEDIVEFDAIQERMGLWCLFDESVNVVIDLHEFERQCESILHPSNQNENDIDSLIKAGHELILLYGRGYLPELVNDEGFEGWGTKEREKHCELYLKALLYVANCAETAGQQRQDEQQLACVYAAAEFYLECAIAASDTLSDAERRGEPALQKCLELYMSVNDILEAKNAYYRFEKHIIDHLCDVWEPCRETKKVWEQVQ